MKGKQKKDLRRMMKSHPSYSRNPNTYWRLSNGEALDQNGNTVFVNKSSDIRDGKEKYTLFHSIKNPFLTEHEKKLIEDIKKVKEGDI